MEVDNGFGQTVIEKKRDEAAERVQKLFQDFLEEFEIEEDGKKLHKYAILAEELAAPEKNTLTGTRDYLIFIWVKTMQQCVFEDNSVLKEFKWNIKS